MSKDNVVLHTVNLADVKGCTVTAKRWCDSVGGVYHSTEVSVLVSTEVANALGENVYNRPAGADIWVTIAENRFAYGYGNQYELTAYALFRAAVQGNFVDYDNVKVGTLYSFCNMAMIQYSENCTDVKRKKDL